MKYRNFIIMLLSALIFTAPTAYAQQDIGDIIDEIFKGGKFPAPAQQSRIDNIPVEISFNLGQASLPVESMLVVTAYAPPLPNVRRASPLMLGQTRLLLVDMHPPLQVIIAAPASLTQNLDYARIEAKIIDSNATVIYELRQSGKYYGYDAANLKLSRVGKIARSTPNNYGNNPAGLSSETVHGTVNLNGQAPKFTGSNLVVRLVEDGLAGGNSNIISGEMRQVLDGKRAPFSFEFERVVGKSGANTPLALEVWIEDWAGRKTHVTPAPIPYHGPDTKYRIKLDAIGALPLDPLATPIPLYQNINAEAHFNAVRGLPPGSVLIAELERVNNGPRPAVLATERVFLDGLSGKIAFKLKVNSADLDPGLPTARLRVRIQDRDGKLLFSNPGGTALRQGFNSVPLTASPNY